MTKNRFIRVSRSYAMLVVLSACSSGLRRQRRLGDDPSHDPARSTSSTADPKLAQDGNFITWIGGATTSSTCAACRDAVVGRSATQASEERSALRARPRWSSAAAGCLVKYAGVMTRGGDLYPEARTEEAERVDNSGGPTAPAHIWQGCRRR
jgi:hypothetical protein